MGFLLLPVGVDVCVFFITEYGHKKGNLGI